MIKVETKDGKELIVARHNLDRILDCEKYKNAFELYGIQACDIFESQGYVISELSCSSNDFYITGNMYTDEVADHTYEILSKMLKYFECEIKSDFLDQLGLDVSLGAHDVISGYDEEINIDDYFFQDEDGGLKCYVVINAFDESKNPRGVGANESLDYIEIDI